MMLLKYRIRVELTSPQMFLSITLPPNMHRWVIFRNSGFRTLRTGLFTHVSILVEYMRGTIDRNQKRAQHTYQADGGAEWETPGANDYQRIIAKWVDQSAWEGKRKNRNIEHWLGSGEIRCGNAENRAWVSEGWTRKGMTGSLIVIHD